MTYRKDIPYVNHIYDAINDIEESIKKMSKADFIKNKDAKEANVRRLEIIGEAAKNISHKLKEDYNYIEWKKISGTRDIAIHRYFGVNFDIIWDILKRDIPVLKKQIEKIKKELGSKG